MGEMRSIGAVLGTLEQQIASRRPSMSAPDAPSISSTPPVSCDLCKDAMWLLRRATDPTKAGETVPCPQCNWSINLRRANLPGVVIEAEGPRMERQFDADNLIDPLVLDDVRAYLACLGEHVAEGQGLLLWGESKGSGKTRLAAQIGMTAVMAGHDTRFATSQGLLDAVKAGFDAGNADAIFAEYADCDLLILDELGSEQHTAYSQTKLFELINHRLSKGRATVVTSNYAPERLGGEIAPTDRMMGERIASRMVQACIPIRVEGRRDYRGVLAEERRLRLRARATA